MHRFARNTVGINRLHQASCISFLNASDIGIAMRNIFESSKLISYSTEVQCLYNIISSNIEQVPTVTQ